jgi:hypothetical protein
MDELASANMPDPNGAVGTSTDDLLAISGDGYAIDAATMAAELMN